MKKYIVWILSVLLLLVLCGVSFARECPQCNGQGGTRCGTCFGSGRFKGQQCTSCHGRGIYNICTCCGGTGNISDGGGGNQDDDSGENKGIEISSANFPASVFRTYISTNFDKDSNGYLTDDERSQVTSISLSSKNISDLTGLGHFPALESLNCSGNKITGLDLKDNTALTELYCSNNQIAYLNVSMCSDLKALDCSGNKMNNLELGNLSQLSSLKCVNNNLSLLDVSGTPKLSSGTFTHDSGVQVFTGIAVNTANFPDANFRACIDTDGNGVLSYAEVSVTELYLPAKNISSLKGIEYFTALTSLNCGNNSLTALDVRYNTALTSLICSDNQLTSLILGSIPLTTLDCSNNSLTALDVSNNTVLTELYCSNNRLVSLILDCCNPLTALDCSSNSLTALNVSYNTALKTLDCSDNQLTSLILGSAPLTTLDCSSNSLTVLNLSKNTALTSFNCSNNQLTSLILGNTSELVSLECENNKLTQLDIGGCSKLRGFTRDSGVKIIDRLGTEINATNFPDSVFRSYVSNFDTDGSGSLRAHEISEVWKMDVSNKNISSLKGIECFSELQELNCSHNNLTALDVSKNTALWGLYCNHNSLRTLDVSKNIALTMLYCENNKLTVLTLGKNSELSTLTCQNNKLTQINITDCPKLLQGRIFDIYKETYIYRTIDYDSGLKIITDQPFVEQASGIQVNAINFPDSIFRAYVSENFDTDSSGYLNDEEIANVQSIDLDESGVSSVKGLEYFTALTELHLYKNKLTVLDISKNTYLQFLDCGENQLTALDVSNNQDLMAFSCQNNKLTALDVSKNSILVVLWCYKNQLTALDVSKNTFLEELRCYSNKLTALDVTKNTALNKLVCWSNQLSGLNVSKNTALKYLDCSYNSLAALDVTKNTLLETLYCEYNQLTALNVSSNSGLVYLQCDHNKLTSLTLGNNSVLETVKCGNNSLTQIDISGCPKLASGTFTYDSSIRIIDSVSSGIAINAANFPDEIFRAYVSGSFDKDSNGYLNDEEISAVTKFSVAGLGISSLKGIEYFTVLTQLHCPSNQLTELDVSKNILLTTLQCHDNQLHELDVSSNNSLKMLVCHDNQLSELDVSNNTALEIVSCSYNQLTSLDVSNNTALEWLFCDNNQLAALDVSNNTALTELYCHNNQLTALNVSKNTALMDLDCSDNQLTTLNIGSNSVLDTLQCENNNLTRIDISGCPKLTTITFIHDSGLLIIDSNTTLSILPETLPNGTVGTAYSAALSSNLSAYWFVSGLPSWLNTPPLGWRGIPMYSYTKIALTGTPSTAGSYTFTVEAWTPTAKGVLSASKQYTITIEADHQPTYTLNITNTSPASVQYGAFYRETLTAEYMGENVNAVWSATGLPSWLTLDPDTGELRGIVEDWSAAFTVKAVYGNLEAVKEFTITDPEAGVDGGTGLVIENKSLASAETGKYYSEKLSAYAGDSTPDLAWSAYEENAQADFSEVPHSRTYRTWRPDNITWTIDYGSLPEGLSLNASTGEISGTPAKTGDYTFIVTALYSSYKEIKASKQFTITVSAGNSPEIPQAEDDHPEFNAGHALVLEGQIGVIFFVSLPEEPGTNYTDKNCWVEFDIRGDKSNPPQPLDVSHWLNTNINGVKHYAFVCYINSAQMADPITATLHYGNNQTITQNYSADDYLTSMLARTDFSGVVRDLMAAIKDYGHYVQPMLSNANNWKIGELFLEMKGENVYTADDIENVRTAAKKYEIIRDPGNTGISDVGFALKLGSTTSILLYLDVKPDYTGNVGAYSEGSSENLAVRQQTGQYEYVIEIPDIPAHELNKTNVITVTAGGTFEIRVSALSYVDTMLNKEGVGMDIKEAVTALYKYYEAATAYQNSTRR